MTKTRILCFTMLFAVGCGSTPKPSTYGGHARQAYQLGMEALADSNFIEAVQHFTSVKNKYPYSQYAALAELRIGDTYYAQDKFVESIGAYRTFVQRRPNHREVAYALWKIGESYFEQRPSNFFLFPPGYEKDRSATKDAVRSYRVFLKRFPKHEQSAAAKSKLKTCRGDLADYELYVAQFYLRQDRPRSAVGRLETLHRGFDDLPTKWRLASLMLIDVYLKLGERDKEGDVFIKDARQRASGVAERIIQKYPKSPAAVEAKRALKKLGPS